MESDRAAAHWDQEVQAAEAAGEGVRGGAAGSGVEPSEERVSLLFDGVYGLTDVWLNGHYLGRHIYGYTAFSFRNEDQ